MCFASRKCACRRELNSHEFQFSMMQRLEADGHSARRNSLISVRAGVSAGQSKGTAHRQERRQEAAARFGKVGSARMNEEHGQQGRVSCPASTSRGPRFKVVVRDARRTAPCKTLGMRRRRGVPRLLLLWRSAGSRIARMQMQPRPPALRTDA